MNLLRPYQKKSVQETFKELSSSSDPVLFVMSVGGGKSICSASICKRMQDLNKHVLCLVNSAELVRNNYLAFENYGGSASVFCASLKQKKHSASVIFATPQSIIAAIKRKHPIASRIFNLIIVDEAHGIAYKNSRSVFMRILRHYKQSYASMRLLGLSGTPFRLDSGATESIVGEHALFKKTVANITTQWLIENNYLAKPEFGITSVKNIDTSSYDKSKSAKKRQEALNSIGSSNKRLTWEILQEVQETMKDRNGAFIFCSSIQHCYEAMEALPKNQARIIIGSTTDEDRNEILTLARNKEIKYLVSVSCLLVGIDVPYFCTSVFLRPTNSLTLFMQAIGRSLRLHPEKETALVLDYAQNLVRFSDFDDPIINEALAPNKEDDPEYCIICYQCNTLNKTTARRCRGIKDNKRCDYFFEWKDCVNCQEKNDATARQCRQCEAELIDPNAKLSLAPFASNTVDVKVLQARYWVTGNETKAQVHAQYIYQAENADPKTIMESYSPMASEKSKNFFYGKWVKKCVDNSSEWYPHLQNYYALKRMLHRVKTPEHITLKFDGNKWIIYKRLFQDTPESQPLQHQDPLSI